QQISGLRRAKSDDTRRVGALRPYSLDPSFSLDRSSNQRDKINCLSQLVDVQPGHEVEPRRFFLKHQRINGVQIFQSRNQTTPCDQLVRKIDTLRVDRVPQLAKLRDLDWVGQGSPAVQPVRIPCDQRVGVVDQILSSA